MFWRIILSMVLTTNSNVVISQEWHLDLSEAMQIAKDSGRNILLVFSGSDWCAPCMKLEKEVWETKEFQEYAKDNYVLVRADFPRRKSNQLSEEQQEKNNQLAERYNRQGAFPLVVIMDVHGNVFGKTGYQGIKATEYIVHLNEFIN